MSALNRRSFLKGAGAAVTACLLGANSRVLGANEDLRVAIVGFKGRGKNLIEGFQKQKGVRIVALCDVDKDVLGEGVKKFADGNEKVEPYGDVRKLLENKDVDIIATATPNHWHALISVWACQAGKDVYVEKPVSHNVWEGRQIVEAARKYGKIVQTGTQSRSNPGMREAIEFLQSGGLGKIKVVRGLCYKRRDSIGKVEGEQKVPDTIDYDLWSGPAPMEPLRRKKLHYDWHWTFTAGNGDLGNQGIHQMDIARWILKADALSPKILSLGGRLGYVDDGTTPNTQIVYHGYAPAPLIFEVRGLPEKPGAKEMPQYKGASVGVVTECEGGYCVMPTYSTAIVYDNSGKEIKTFGFQEGKDGKRKPVDGDHFANFVEAVKSRKHTDLHADINEGHLSSSLCHTANISHLMGAAAGPDEVRAAIKDQPAMGEAFARMEEHLGINGVKLGDTKVTLGSWLEMDTKTERFTNNEKANGLLTRQYRAPFVVPEKV